MPVDTLVIVPTSCGVSCGAKAARARLIPENASSKTSCRFWGRAHGLFAAGLGVRSSAAAGSWLRGSAFSFRSSPTAFSSDDEIIGDAPREFLPVGGELDATDEVRRGLEAQRGYRPKRPR